MMGKKHGASEKYGRGGSKPCCDCGMPIPLFGGKDRCAACSDTHTRQQKAARARRAYLRKKAERDAQKEQQPDGAPVRDVPPETGGER